MMDKLFAHVPWSRQLVYLDDLAIHTKNVESNRKQLRESFEILKRNNLMVKANKTFLLMDQMTFCGHIIKNGTRYPNEKKVEAVKELRKPTTKKEAQSVFGLLSYHRTYIPNFAQKCKSITRPYAKSLKWD